MSKRWHVRICGGCGQLESGRWVAIVDLEQGVGDVFASYISKRTFDNEDAALEFYRRHYRPKLMDLIQEARDVHSMDVEIHKLMEAP